MTDLSADSEDTFLILEKDEEERGWAAMKLEISKGGKRALCAASKMYFKRTRYTCYSTMIHGGDFWYDSITKLVNRRLYSLLC